MSKPMTVGAALEALAEVNAFNARLQFNLVVHDGKVFVEAYAVGPRNQPIWEVDGYIDPPILDASELEETLELLGDDDGDNG